MWMISQVQQVIELNSMLVENLLSKVPYSIRIVYTEFPMKAIYLITQPILLFGDLNQSIIFSSDKVIIIEVTDIR